MEIGFTREGWFVLRMDPLASNKDEASKAWVRATITPEIRKFFADKDTVRYPKCTVIFRHVYDREHPEYGLRDYDNVEVKLVLDIVAMYVMVDDSPLQCNVYHCSAPGPHPFSEVYVIPPDRYGEVAEEGAPFPRRGRGFDGPGAGSLEGNDVIRFRASAYAGALRNQEEL